MKHINNTHSKDTIKKELFIKGILSALILLIVYFGFFHFLYVLNHAIYGEENAEMYDGCNYQVDYVVSNEDKTEYYYHLSNGKVYTYTCQPS